MRIKPLLLISGGIIGVFLGLNWIQTIANPSNPVLQGPVGRVNTGSSYWSSSNLREWLNSADIQVDYTNNPPSDQYTNNRGYDEEAGFLNEFTKEEVEQIAITKHRTLLLSSDSSAKDGGTKSTPHANIYGPAFLANYASFAFSYQDWHYKSDLDKVFLLGPTEAYWYLNRRGFSYARPLTPQAAEKHGVSTKATDWWLMGGTRHSENDKGYYAQTANNLINHGDPITQKGVVPALHLKPDAVLQDGTLAKDLSIGEIVKFGRYLGVEIEWQVINITNEGYPLLLSANVLDLKVFDGKGDGSKQFSETIDWGVQADVSILDDLQYRSTTQHQDREVPLLTIKDDTFLYERQNGAFTLEFEATDKGGSGIKWIELPNGQRITDSHFSYTFSENENYIFKLMDRAGNYNEHLLAVSNINAESQIVVGQSQTAWSNQPIQIEILAVKNIEQVRTTPLTISNKNGYGGSVFPNYISYANQAVRISGRLKLIDYPKDRLDLGIRIGVHYRGSGNSLYTQTITGHWKTVRLFTVEELLNQGGEILFDLTYTIPENYYQRLTPYIETNYSSAYDKTLVFEIEDLKYEILSDSDIAIHSIQLPSGDLIEGESYVDTISAEGIHDWTYTITDNRGMITEKTITTKIDRTLPQLTITPDVQNDDTYEKTYHIQASDELSGVNRLEYRLTGATTQDWTTFEGDSLSLTIEKAGTTTLTVRAYDEAGNRKEQTITVQVDDEVFIKDNQLAQVIRQTLGLATDEPIFKSHMESLVELDASNQQITDLTGLETAKQLKKLSLQVNNIQDLAPISSLSRLETLILDENPIQDLTALTTLPRLQTLSLNTVDVVDWTPLSQLTEIRELHLEQNQIQDLSFAAGFKKITHLNLANNQIESVEALKGLTRLEQLNLSNNQVQDVSSLQDLEVELIAAQQDIFYEAWADEQLSFENPLKNKDGSYVPLDFNDSRVQFSPDYSTFKIVYSFLNEMPVTIPFEGTDNFKGTITFHLQSDLTKIPQDLSLNGTFEPTILSFTVPSQLEISIDVNQEISFIAPEFEIRNESGAPLRLSLKQSELISDQLQLVPLDQYLETEWNLLDKERSKQLALGLQRENLGTPIDLSISQPQEVGVISPYHQIGLSFIARHGRAFTTQEHFKIRLTFILELLP